MKARSISKPNLIDCRAGWPLTIQLIVLALWLAGCTAAVPIPDSTATTAPPTATSKSTHEIALAEPVITVSPAVTVTPAPTQVATKLPTPPAPSDDLGSLMNVTPAPTSIPLPPLPERLNYELTLVNQLGGRATAMAINGDLAYVAVGPRLVVVDLSDPTALTEIGRSDMLPAPILLMAVDGTMAFVVTEEMQALYQLDLSDSDMPFLVTSLPLPPIAQDGGERVPVELLIHQGNLYLGERQRQSEESWIALYVLSSPALANRVWSAPVVFAGTLSGLIPLPDHLYLLTPNRLIVLWIPADGIPTAVAEHENVFKASNGLVIDEQLYLMGAELNIMDITDPRDPIHLQRLWQNYYLSVKGLIVSGTRILIANFGGDVVLWSSLYSLESRSQAPLEWQRHQVWNENERAMDLQRYESTAVLLTDHGLYLFEIEQGDDAILIGRWVTMGPVADALPVGGDLIIGSFTSDRVSIWDISIPNQPSFGAELSGVDWGGSMTASGSVVGIPSIYGYLTQVYMDSRETARTQIGGILVGFILGQAGDYLYAYTEYWSTMLLYDSHDPGPEPEPLATLHEIDDLPWLASAVAYPYFVAMTDRDVRIYDIEEGLAIAEAGLSTANDREAQWPFVASIELATLSGAPMAYSALVDSAITVKGDLLYVLRQTCDANSCDGDLHIFNISHPQQPQLRVANQLVFHGYVAELVVVDQWLLLVGQELVVIDVRVPEAPVLAGRYMLPDTAANLHMQGGYLYVATDAAGLCILRIDPT